MEHICPLYLQNYLNSHELVFVYVCLLFFLQVLCLSLCIIPLLYMYYLSVVVVNNMQCFFSSSIYLWWRQAKMSGKRSTHTHTQSNNHLDCSILRYLFGEIWLWWMPNVVIATNKSTFEETLAYTQWSEKVCHSLYMVIYFIGSCQFILFNSVLNRYFGFHFRRLGAAFTNTNQAYLPLGDLVN